MTVPIAPLKKTNLTFRLVVNINFAPLHRNSLPSKPPALSEGTFLCIPSDFALSLATGAYLLASKRFFLLWNHSSSCVGNTNKPYSPICSEVHHHEFFFQCVSLKFLEPCCLLCSCFVLWQGKKDIFKFCLLFILSDYCM